MACKKVIASALDIYQYSITQYKTKYKKCYWHNLNSYLKKNVLTAAICMQIYDEVSINIIKLYHFGESHQKHIWNVKRLKKRVSATPV